MAVKEKSAKRKNAENFVDSEVVVPKKVVKKCESSIQKPNDNHKERQSNAFQSTEVEEYNKLELVKIKGEARYQDIEFKNVNANFSKDFKILNFRNQLRGTNFLTELRHFLHLSQTRPEIVAKYIEKRGKPLELTEAFERIDKLNILHVAYLCEALQLVLMEIVSNQKHHMESARHACRFFLKIHGSVVNVLLNSTDLRHRRIALKLLTSIVCVEPQLGRQLLSSYDILLNTKAIENFLSYSKFDSEMDTVRNCFINFVLSYLVEGNILLIRNILDRPSILHGLISQLLYDDHVTICVVLSTLRKYVLECVEISKTKKIHVFDLNCCKQLVRLYDWKGPKIYATKFEKKKGSPGSCEADTEHRNSVTTAVHAFLLVLLTSRKYGISFDTITHFQQKYNSIQGKIIGFLYKPWCDERKTDLVMKILDACPDLARNTVRNYAGIVNVIRTASSEWVRAANFLTAIIQTLHPKLLHGALDKITLTDFSYWIKDICFPIETLVLLNGSKILRHENTEVRIATNRLLLAMFTQYSNYMLVIKKREPVRGGDNAMRRFNFDILNHIIVNFPSVDNILYSLYMTTQAKNISDADVLSHLNVTLDLVLIISRKNRAFVTKTNAVLDYLKLLRPLYALNDKQNENQENIKLELKAIKTILSLFPKALEPKEELFASVLDSFIKIFVYGEQSVQREAGVLLHYLFKNTGLFDGNEFEIDFWLEPLRYLDVDTVKTVTQAFIEVLQVANANVEIPKTAEVAKIDNLRKLFENIENGFSVQAYMDTLSISKLMSLILKGIDILPQMEKYLDIVSLLIFHYYPTPEFVMQLYRTELNSLNKYMTKWLSTTTKTLEPSRLDVVGHCIPHLAKVYTNVLNGDYELNVFEYDVADENMKPNERLFLIYVQLVMFLMAQLLSKGRLLRPQGERAAAIINHCLSKVNILEAEESDKNMYDKRSVLNAMLKYIFNVRILYVPTIELFSEADESHLNYIHFLHMLAQNSNGYINFDQHTTNYRLIIVKAIALVLNNLHYADAEHCKLVEIIKLINSFKLQVDNCTDIMNLIASSKLKTEHIVGSSLKFNVYHELIVSVLQRLTALHATVNCDAFIVEVVNIYTCYTKYVGNDANLESLEKALYDFLLVSHQHIPALGITFFQQMFVERKITKVTIRLACLLLERDDKLTATFIENLPNNLSNKELTYPLLSVALQKHVEIDVILLQNIYQEYKNGFMKTIEKPQKAALIYREHVDCSITLIQQCMPIFECVDFTNKSHKIDGIEIFQMRLIYAIHEKALNSLNAKTALKQYSLVFTNFVNLQIQMLTLDLRKQMLNMQKLKLFAYHLYEWWQHLITDIDYSKIVHSSNWVHFCKACLKAAMQLNERQVEEKENESDAFRGLLLQLLAFVCDRLHIDYRKASVEGEGVVGNSEASQLFEMICTHSRFYDILLTQYHEGSAIIASKVKTQLLHLLFVLAKKSATSLSGLEIPTILGAYQARLTDSDRYALALLQLFQQHECGLDQYRPLVWGESAISFYALRSCNEERAKLKQQETSIAQVMSLIDKQICEYTIENFPIWRKLNSLEQLPTVRFENPEEQIINFGFNSIERRVEAGIKQFDESELRLCPKRDDVYERCYDPAFFVPLMSFCFAPESFAHPARPVQNGLLALAFTALSSQDKDMRLASGSVQQRYHAHFEQNKFYERPLWLQAYENIQAGLNELTDSWIKHKKNSGIPRVPLIPCLFVAKTFNLISDPTHLLYKQLTMYLHLKSSFNFQCVPEFNVLFFSPDVEHQAHRQFIIEVIRNGIKCSSDLFLLVSTNIFKVLMSFYGCTMSTLETNLLILSVFSTCVKIPASTKIIIEQLGILPWLSSIINSVEFHQFDIIEGLIAILNNLWFALKANQLKFHNFDYYSLELHRQLLALAPHLSARIDILKFAKFLNILNKTASNCHLSMPNTQLDNLISCTEIHYPTLVRVVKNIRQLGGDGAAPHNVYCKELQEQQADSIATLTLSSLRAYTIDWWQAHHQLTQNF